MNSSATARPTEVVVDTGPLLAAVNARERAHGFASELIRRLGRRLIIPLPVLVEADYMIRSRVGLGPARRLLAAAASAAHELAFMSQGVLRRAVELDQRYGDLNLGLADTSVMAVAERRGLPILTFDFADFRATESERGPWRLLVDEALLEAAIRRGRR